MTTRHRIVTAMAELLRHQGYAATRVQQLATAAGAPTGSIYHHFRRGKVEVAEEAFRETGAAYGQLIRLLLDEHDDLATAVEAVFRQAAETAAGIGWANMCPVATVVAEVADTEPRLREVGAEVVQSWVDDGVGYLTSRGLSEPAARTLTYAMVSALEGAFLLARGQRTQDPLLAAGWAMASAVRSLQAQATPDATTKTTHRGS